MDSLLTIFQQWSGLVGLVVACIVAYTRNENKTEDNTQAILRLETTIQKLVDKIDKLLDAQADTRAEIASIKARVTNLEK